MQLYALDSQQQLIFAEDAIKQQDYFCLECQQVVRRRGGAHRHDHFYHFAPTESCRQNGKGMLHLHIQYSLQKLLPRNECVLEHRFGSINRIADVAWLTQKLIFEIQCSPISAEELQARNRDYLSQGFQVVWLLHDNRFNQLRLSAAEDCVRVGPYYFVSIEETDQVVIYDQFEIIDRGLRKFTLKPLPVNIARPLQKALTIPATPSKVLMERFTKWPLHFSGDLIDTCIVSATNSDYLQQVLEAEIAFLKTETSTPIPWWRRVINKPLHFYKLCLQILLERACR